MTPPILELGGISVSRAGAPVLHQISLSVGAGETVALLGANGAGKSTLLRALMGLVPLAAGTIRFSGRQIGDLSTEARAWASVMCQRGGASFLASPCARIWTWPGPVARPSAAAAAKAYTPFCPNWPSGRAMLAGGFRAVSSRCWPWAGR